MRRQQHKYETPIAPGVAAPDKADTSIGTLLNLSYGYPDAASVQTVYDLDRSRALQAYLLGIPNVNQGVVQRRRKFGPDKRHGTRSWLALIVPLCYI